MNAVKDDKISRILETVGQMTPDEAAELKEKFKEKFGITFPQPYVPDVPFVKAEVEEKTSFRIVLAAITGKKLDVLKAIRECVGYTLQECKESVENLPHQFAGEFPKKTAEEIKQKLTTAGAKIELK